MNIIAVSSRENQYDLLLELAKTGRTEPWTVPRSTQPGDVVIFYIAEPVKAFVASGVVHREAEMGFDPEPDWAHRYSAEVGDVTLLDHQIPRKEMLKMVPDWRWPMSPLNVTTLNPDVAPLVLDALGVNP